MTYDSPFLAELDLMKEVGLLGSANLEGAVAGETFDRADLIKAAHNGIYQELESRGIDPTKLTNETRLKAAIAYEWCMRAAAQGLLERFGERAELVAQYRELRDEAVRRFVPQVVAGDPPRVDGVPSVANFEPGWDYGPVDTGPTGQRYWDDLPEVR